MKYCSLSLALAFLALSTPAFAESGDVEVSVEAQAGLPVTGYLTPPGKNDGHAQAGGVGLLSLDLGLSSSWSVEVLGGIGYLGEFQKDASQQGSIIGQVGLGPKLRLLDSQRLWLSAHGGLYQFDGTQFGFDAGAGYDFGQSENWRCGPLVRYQLAFAGNEDPNWPDQSRPDAALWLGFAIRHGHTHDYNKDIDGDGLTGKDDRCPQDAEDRDGFQDEDGCPDPDNDFDGLPDTQDKCPLEAEDIDQFEDTDGCPDLDNDKDGLLDTVDQCPTEAEDIDQFQDEDGCPDRDNDQDSVPDTDDKCPLEAEDIDGFSDSDGCPDPDNDKDGVPDADDQCPREPGTAESKGCPKAVRLDEETHQIKILEKIEFEFGSAKLKAGATSILEEVAAILVANPSIEKVRVEGHSDDQGPDAVNMKLSTERSASVVVWLVEHDVAKERLSAFGCGETYPMESNKTAAGREKNRRVEFHIGGTEPSARAECTEAP